MAEADHDRTKLDASPDSTWGATELVKTKWHDKYGKAVEKAAARDEKEKRD